MKTIQTASGLWPVMLTPFLENGEVDYPSLERLIHWYEENGANGLFAVCQSSEMFFLSLRERLEIAKFVKRHARIPVIASGHISSSLQDQLEELRAMSQTGVDAVILITNRMDIHGGKPETWKENLCAILDALDPGLPLGLYECPHPYKRLLSDDEIAFAAHSGRFLFLKDTCCDMGILERRLKIIGGTRLRLFNANASTLLPSLEKGAAGFSGVMANFHPQLYAKLLGCWKADPKLAGKLQALLSLCSQIERQYYPLNAKYHLLQEGIFTSLHTRCADPAKLSPLFRQEVQYMNQVAALFEKDL